MCVEARVLWMEQDRLVSPSTLATNYAITGTFITAWSVNEQNGVREKKIDGQKRVAPSKAVTNLRPLFGERESPPEG